MEFHVSHQSRARYQFDAGMFRYDGNVIFADFQAVRAFTQKINTERQRVGDRLPVSSGDLNALGLIDEIMHFILDTYRQNLVPDLNQKATDWVQDKVGSEELEKVMTAFCVEFPPVAVEQGKMTVKEYLAASNPKGKLNRYEVIEEILLLWIMNQNPAAMKYFDDLFDDQNLTKETAFLKVISALYDYSLILPKIEGLTLIDFLLEPSRLFGDSIFDQLNFIQSRWGSHLGSYLRRLLVSLDLFKEEFADHGMGPGPVEIPVYDDSGSEGVLNEYEAFSQDLEWMPRLVLIAKNIYVWLDQLSKQYGRPITRLNEIPEEELRNLRDEGFTGLWLIGVWERSKASATIKQYCGNPEALASAYSLADYQIAEDLGGESAFQDLKQKAWRNGIRMASDMVPNHMGIDSGWVLYHPDRFLQLDYCPFPSYSFNGPNLSPDPNIGIFLEDHYYTREDAAVVFQRVNFYSGNVRYIYHGNDGTSMPWNDTAQLNYLLPEVREAVIQTILQVAKRFPIIRFDAAMTLAKKHYQRLWFPEPGTGGAIATRAELGLTKEEFDRVFPEEFWREVVDRVAAEAPDTLLLAEAFWLMEGYFVRTLGMHRVYNSAFMNLLRDEDNAKYRMLIKSTLEYDPDILKRYVNFMNNPDEKTAVEQFGKGDKYFGICVLMVTMPGLPMFGHGQIQGFTEKYGMEYRKAYWDEQVDVGLLQRHEREIFPLLHQRRRFAEVTDFVFYNFATSYGNVDENVFAYSNFGEGRHSLVVYNNRFGQTNGFVRQSVSFVVKKPDGEKYTTQKTLSESLRLHDDPRCYVVLHDAIRDLSYVRPSQQICKEGLYFALNGYQTFAFNEIYEVQDDEEGTWRKLNSWLNGNGTSDINEAIQELLYHDVLEPYRNCFDGDKLRWLYEKVGSSLDAGQWLEIQNGTWKDFETLALAFNNYYRLDRPLTRLFNVYSVGIHEMIADPETKVVPDMDVYNERLVVIKQLVTDYPVLWNALLISLQQDLLARFGRTPESFDAVENIREDWHLYKTQARMLTKANYFERLSVPDQINLIQWLYLEMETFRKWTHDSLEDDLDAILESDGAKRFLKTNEFEGITWFNQEAAELLEILLQLIGYYENVFDPAASASLRVEKVLLMQEASEVFHQRVEDSSFHFDLLVGRHDSSAVQENAESENQPDPAEEPEDQAESNTSDSGIDSE